MTSSNRPSVFIEKIFPVTLLNQQVYYEHGGNSFKGLHRWYSRKPLSFSRASVLGSLLPDSVTPEEFEYLLGLERRLGGVPDTKTKLYKTPPSPERIKQVHDLCEKTWGTRTPTVLDAFAGGGSIPFEAVRYGLNVLASDLNPVAVVTMKAAMEYPLKFGSDLQHEIDKWVKWVGDEVKNRLARFFPAQGDEVVRDYLWAHSVTCPNCESSIPLSPNWWIYKRPEQRNWHKWCAVKPISNTKDKRIDFELIRGEKGRGSTIKTSDQEFDPKSLNTINRGLGKCLNCGNIIENEVIVAKSRDGGMPSQLYAVIYRNHSGSLDFRIPTEIDLKGFQEAEKLVADKLVSERDLFPTEDVPPITRDSRLRLYGIERWTEAFNPRQLLTLVTYAEVIREGKNKMEIEYDLKMTEAVLSYLSLILDRCIDYNSRLSGWHSGHPSADRASKTHSLNISWNYPELSGAGVLWHWCADTITSEYEKLCDLIGLSSETLPGLGDNSQKNIEVSSASADDLSQIPDRSVHAVVTDPPYYATIQYSELSDFFYVWQKRVLHEIFPHLYAFELTEKEREAVANPSRFRNMGESPDVLANRDYEAKMALAFAEYHRVLCDNGVMTVQFNHKDSGAWDVLAKSLIDAGFEITASWAVSTENPQNLHQAQKNSVSSTVLLVCRKRNPDAAQAWWDDLRPELANLVEKRAPEFEANDISGIDLYLSAFGPALNVFSRAWPVLDSAGNEVRPEEAFSEARKAIANYRFRKLLQTDTAGFDPLTQWYILAWDAFRAREFPFDEARQLALAVGGFNVTDLAKIHKLIDSASGTCKLLSPQQRLKRRAFTINPDEFSSAALVDCLHAIIALYLEEQSIEPVRRFMKATGLLSNDLFMRAWEVALKVIPRIGDERKCIPEEKALADLWLAMDEIQAKVSYVQPELALEEGQMGLF